MPIVKEPLEVSCFQCEKKLIIKYVPAQKDYSKKNNWNYWTEKNEDVGKKICDRCLKKIYKKRGWESYKIISNTKKRRLLSNYISNGKI